ncbi:MAG: preprotein translocase subunit YajC [Acidothermales bacterium]|nr:preprotein translocase subunit YajC [Acidothermales bacterium]
MCVVEGLGNLLPLLLLVVLFWFLVFRPARKRQQQAQQTQSALATGQQVMTTAGLIATVSAVEDDVVVLEVAPGVTCRYAKPAVAQIMDQQQSDSAADERQDTTGPDTDPA